ncbi:malectin [Poritiphilus flavus]|uniref:Malectin domain-containing protein n=1 Tax=Poritiphilus flavus TaxID=2697053 RepID=A0A6L9E9S4_9FLAO|nr:malectin [Poritiphilus flavus]NAS11312.1 hypothetical protein [Poritiphilus flavus]
MKAKIPSFLIVFLLASSLCLSTFSCGGSDDNIEPVGMADDTPTDDTPTDDTPTDDTPTDDDPIISDNPVIRINAGGEMVEVDGMVFEQDIYFTEPSDTFYNENVGDIMSTEQDTLYVTERITGTSSGGFSYEIPISNGDYNVNLYFAEIFWGAPDPGDPSGGVGSRIFDVDIEGVVVLNDYDITGEVGLATAVIKTFTVKVEDEVLNIVFTASVDQPKISAIEVLGDGMILP